MMIKQMLLKALSAVEDAVRALKHANNVVANDHDVGRALRELDDAESQIERAIRELPDE